MTRKMNKLIHITHDLDNKSFRVIRRDMACINFVAIYRDMSTQSLTSNTVTDRQ